MACKPRTAGQRAVDVDVGMLVIADMGVDGKLSDRPKPRWRCVVSNVSCAGAPRVVLVPGRGEVTWTAGVTCDSETVTDKGRGASFFLNILEKIFFR